MAWHFRSNNLVTYADQKFSTEIETQTDRFSKLYYEKRNNGSSYSQNTPKFGGLFAGVAVDFTTITWDSKIHEIALGHVTSFKLDPFFKNSALVIFL
jgi:hypothetical protein